MNENYKETKNPTLALKSSKIHNITNIELFQKTDESIHPSQ